MAQDADLLVIWQTAEHATCTRHRNYALSCGQFDALIERAKGCCELCGLEGGLSAWGCLHIDHEHQVGRWAVRGLLCDGCNVRLQRGRRLPPTPPLLRYLENAWYRSELARLGISDEVAAEPGVGSSVATGSHGYMRLPSGRPGCWASRRGSNVTLKSWRELWYDYGPMSIRVTDERDSFPGWAVSLYKSAFSILRYLEQADAKRAATALNPEAQVLCRALRPGSLPPSGKTETSSRCRRWRSGSTCSWCHSRN